jgi:hypothetical protein
MLDRYYFLASLPAMGELGTEPPMGFAELLEHLAGSWSRHVLLGTIFLLDDLVQREAHLAGELAEVDPAVLSVQQASGEQPLPDRLVEYLQASQTQTSGALADRLWEAYFRLAEAVAKRLGSPFLREWVHYEVSLRNALVTMRSKRLGLEAAEYRVAKDLSTLEGDFDAVLAEWASAPTPLAGQQVLLRARWTWVEAHDAWFSFRDDELAAYAIRLMLLQQWSRIASDTPKRAAAEGTA